MGHWFRVILSILMCSAVVYFGYTQGQLIFTACVLVLGALTTLLLTFNTVVTVQQVFYEQGIDGAEGTFTEINADEFFAEDLDDTKQEKE